MATQGRLHARENESPARPAHRSGSRGIDVATGQRPGAMHDPAVQGGPAFRACACGGGCPRCEAQHDGGARGHALDGVLGAPGQPLEGSVRSSLEADFGADFREVRVHADGPAATAAQDLRARACAVGNHIVFDAAEYAPRTAAGRQLLAHELAHVVQQRNRNAPPSALGEVTASAAAEGEADLAAAHVSTGRPVPPLRAAVPAGRVQLQARGAGGGEGAGSAGVVAMTLEEVLRYMAGRRVGEMQHQTFHYLSYVANWWSDSGRVGEVPPPGYILPGGRVNVWSPDGGLPFLPMPAVPATIDSLRQQVALESAPLRPPPPSDSTAAAHAATEPAARAVGRSLPAGPGEAAEARAQGQTRAFAAARAIPAGSDTAEQLPRAPAGWGRSGSAAAAAGLARGAAGLVSGAATWLSRAGSALGAVGDVIRGVHLARDFDAWEHLRELPSGTRLNHPLHGPGTLLRDAAGERVRFDSGTVMPLSPQA